MQFLRASVYLARKNHPFGDNQMTASSSEFERSNALWYKRVKKWCGTLVSSPNGQIYPTFLVLWISTSTSKKVPRSLNPTNINSWDGCHLFSNSTSPIKGSKSGAEHWLLDQMAKSLQLFFALIISTSTSRKVPRSLNPTNITSWDGWHLFSNSTSPIKESKSHAEHWFLDQMAKSIQFFFTLWILNIYFQKGP